MRNGLAESTLTAEENAKRLSDVSAFLRRKRGPPQPDSVDADDATIEAGERKRDHIHNHGGVALDHDQFADANELVDARGPADRSLITHAHVSAEQHAVDQRDMIAHRAIVADVAAGQQETELEPVAVSSFSEMDATMRLSYVDEISAEQDGFFEQLKALLKDTMSTMSPFKWKLLLSTLGGGLGGLFLVWFIKKFVIALCCSVVGALLVLVGIENLLMAAGFQMCSAFGGHRFALSVTYFSMVGIGAIVQLIIARSKKPEEAEAESKKKKK